MLNELIWGLCMLLSVVFVTLSSPHLLIVVLILETLTGSFFLGVLKVWVWSSYILFLVFLGGMLVLFCYVSSLAPQDILEEMDVVFLTLISGGSVFVLIYLFSLDSVIVSAFSSEGMNISSVLPLSNVKESFSMEAMILYMFTVMFLLLALICVVNMMKSVGKPLRLLK